MGLRLKIIGSSHPKALSSLLTKKNATADVKTEAEAKAKAKAKAELPPTPSITNSREPKKPANSADTAEMRDIYHPNFST